MQSKTLKIGDLVIPKNQDLPGVGLITDVKMIRIGNPGDESIMETTSVLWSDGSETLTHRCWSSINLIVVQSSL